MDFEEDLPYTVGRMEGDLRRYWKNRPLAQQYANEGQRVFADSCYTVSVQFQPDHGFVAILHCYHNLPKAWEEGFEVQTPADVEKQTPTPTDWARPQRPKPTAGGGSASGTASAPVRGATARVWAIADEVGAQSRADRQKVIDACVAEGINKSTAGTQWSKYAKAKGW